MRKQLETQKTATLAAKKAGETAENLKEFVSRVYGELVQLKDASGAGGGLSTQASNEISALRMRLEELEQPESSNGGFTGSRERVA